MEKEALVCSWSLWDCGVIFKDLFPWWWYSVVRIGINISSDDWGGVIVLSAIFTAPGMHSLSLKSGYYSRHAKFNHLGPEEVMLKHRKKARESNLVLPNSKQEVLMVVLFYNCWMIRDKQWIILFYVSTVSNPHGFVMPTKQCKWCSIVLTYICFTAILSWQCTLIKSCKHELFQVHVIHVILCMTIPVCNCRLKTFIVIIILN